MNRLLLGLLLTLPVKAQSLPVAPFTINRKVTMAQVDRGGRVELFYDLSHYPGCSMVVTCFRYLGPGGSPKMAEWTVPAGAGMKRLDFKKMPVSQYIFKARLLDANQQPVAADFKPVQLEYGGWSGRLRVEEATRKASSDTRAPFGVIPQQTEESSDYEFKVTPEAVVVAPGGQANLAATLNNRPVAEELQWFLNGPGKLMVVENFIACYLADPKAEEDQRATITVLFPRHPQMRQDIQVLVTREKVKAAEE
ncbi:MAG: hypothetical protein U0931_40455 [Vulcanimicrobiota bacterium]